MGLLAHDVEADLRRQLANQRKDRIGKPRHRIHIGPVIHLAGEDQGTWRHVCEGRRDSRPVEVEINAVRHDRHVQRRVQPVERIAVGFRNGHHAIGLAADAALVACQLSPLDERIGRRHPTPRPAHIRQERALLEHIFGVVVVINKPGRAAARPHLASQRQHVGRHLDALDLDHIVGRLDAANQVP